MFKQLFKKTKIKAQSPSPYPYLSKRRSRKRSFGFTLTEVLVTTIIAGIATISLSSLMFELTQSDNQETVLTQTQQEMQKAISYIADDLRGAVYVYETDKVSPYIPSFSDSTLKPILQFWKTEQLDEDEFPANSDDQCESRYSSDEALIEECKEIINRRSAYSLVVYLQSTKTDPQWQGESRIVRYELPKYKDIYTMTRNTGFVDPSNENNFPNWPKDKDNINNLQASRPLESESPPKVLVDYVDKPNRSISQLSQEDITLETCLTDYRRTPGSEANFNSFYACVRKNDDEVGKNQDIILYLRGNAKGRGGLRNEEILPMLQTRVTLRGVIDKST